MVPLKELLDLTYELEALVTLALNRDGSHSRLNHLIAAKAATIARAAGASCDDAPVAETESQTITYCIDDSAPSLDSLEKESTVEEKIDTEMSSVDEIQSHPKNSSIQNAGSDALRRRFSLNDKFRFRRELFDGDDAAFNDALDTIAEADNLSDAEDYLYSQLKFDPDADAVKALVSIITGYFE